MEENNYRQQLQDVAEDAEILDDIKKIENITETTDIDSLEELLKQKYLYYTEYTKRNSTKHGCNPKTIKSRRKKNKNKKTHRK